MRCLLLVSALAGALSDSCCGVDGSSGVCAQATMVGTTCCAGDLETAAGSNVCSGWTPDCDPTTGAGCCCEKGAMLDPAKPFCANSCSKAAG